MEPNPFAVGADGLIVHCAFEREVALVHVELSSIGVELRADRLVDGSIGADVMFKDVELPENAVLLCGALADKVMRTMLDEATLAASAMLLGIANRALGISVDYMTKRVQFGQAIGTYQALQHRAVDMGIRCALAGATLRRAIELHEAGDAGAQAAISAAKAFCSRTATTVARTGVQFHGGIGYTDAAEIGLFLKCALRFSGFLGTPQMHRRRFMSGSQEKGSSQ